MDNYPLVDLLRCPLHPDAGRLIQVDKADLPSTLAARGDEGLRCLRCGCLYPVVDGIPDLLPSGDSFMEAESHQWDEHAHRYEARRIQDFRYMAGVNAAVSALQIQPGDVVLDAGCGTGLTVRKYLRPGVRVVALDLSLESLRYLRKTSESAPPAVIRGDLKALPFASGSFDKVLCSNAIQQMPEDSLRRQSIGELARVARPNAQVIVTTQNWSKPRQRAQYRREGAAGSHSGRIQYVYRFESQEFHAHLSSALVVERLMGAGFPLPYCYKLSPLSHRLERLLRRFQASIAWGDMLVGICRKA
jgi:ubiquinone/menaquinone biosynthesis C-methylase UbiE/uncharacterized protein YbaR (Trm112 family)